MCDHSHRQRRFCQVIHVATSRMEFQLLPLNPHVPEGWRLATCSEFEQNRLPCLDLLSEWAIVALADGKCDGSGYGGVATRGVSHDGIGEMLITRGGSSQQPAASLQQISKIAYLDDIPEGHRLLSCSEFLNHRSACLQLMGQWDICLLTDGKCDGEGYGGQATALSREQRENSSKTNERMGEMLIGLDDCGRVSAFKSEVLRAYERHMSQASDSGTVNAYLTYTGSSYKPYVLVSSCPGDSHGGVHSRVKSFTESKGWRFAPVFFADQRNAADWKRLWKIQVEEFACETVAEGNTTILEVKIDGGGSGCHVERSRNMTQWWIDWVKRLGGDICHDLERLGAHSSLSLPGCVQIQIGQVLTSEAEFLSFTDCDGKQLSPMTVKGMEFEQHTLVLHGGQRFWVLVTEGYRSNGAGSFSRDSSKHFSSCGTF